MAVYDDEKEKLNPAQHDDLGVHPERREAEIDELEKQYAAPSHTPKKKKLSPQELETAESETSEAAPPETDLYHQESPSLMSRFKGKGRSKKKKYLLLGGLGGIGMIFVIIMILIFLLSSLKLVHLAENITVWNMARSAREFRQSVSQNTEETIATETMDDGVIAGLKQRYGETRLAAAIDKVNQYRPEKMFQKFNAEVKPVFEDGPPRKLLPGNTKIFKGYEVDGNFISAQDRKFFRPIQNYREKIRFSAEMDALFEERYRDTNSLVRSSALSKFLESKGIKLHWWEKKGANYQGLKADAAERLAQSDEFNKVAEPSTSNCKVAEICETASDAEDRVKNEIDQEVAAGAEGVGAAELENNVAEVAAKRIAQGTVSSAISKVESYGSVIYSVALPVCLIYDGSIENSKDTTDANETSLERMYFSVRTAADQQKAGDTTSEAVGGFNGKVGNIGDSIPQMRVSTTDGVDSASQTNPLTQPQASGVGTYSLLDVLFGEFLPHSAISVATTVTSHGCKFVTDIRTGAVLTVAEVVGAVFSGGSSAAAEEGASVGVKEIIAQLVDRVSVSTFRQILEEQGVRAASRYAAEAGGKFLIKTGVWTAATFGATEMAKIAVLKHMNAINNGLETDEAFANQADMGGNLYANETSRQMLYGRPLTTPEVAESHLTDVAYLRDVSSHKSVSERYFALSNPSSLVATLGTSLSNFMSRPGTLLAKVFASANNIISASSSLFGQAFGSHRASAATVSGAGDYNIVQWGWSDAETAQIDQNPEYFPLNNELILDQTGKRGEIEAKYGKCFTDSDGELLSNADIKRNTDGKVVADDGLCSPKNLGLHNDQYGDLVFRWRLAKRNENSQQHLQDIQDVSQ